jgi:hypothetical protein
MAEISYHLTTSDQKVHSSSSITLMAPECSSDDGFPIDFSIDNFLATENTYNQAPQLFNTYQLKQNPREEATKLHFVILGKQIISKTGFTSPREYYSLYGIILAPSRLHTGACVRLGIWNGRMLFFRNVKFEFTIV